MRLGAIALAILSVFLVPTTASAIETHSTSPFHQLIAEAIVPDRNNEQLYFSVVAGTFWTPEVQRYADSDGIYYQFGGTTELALDDKTTTLQPGDGVFIQAGSKFTLRSADANRSPTYLQFLLSAAPGAEAQNDADGASRELYRSPAPVPGLTHERNLLSLTRVPVPPQALPARFISARARHCITSSSGWEPNLGKGGRRPMGRGRYRSSLPGSPTNGATPA